MASIHESEMSPAVLSYVNRLQRERDAMVGVLDELLEYFEDRQDADHDQDGYIPNTEMKMATMIRDFIETL